MSNNFVHLHVHTSYSLLDGVCRPGELIGAVVDNDMRAVAITDHGNMFGVVDFYKKARKRGIKPIIGCEVYVAPGSRTDRNPPKGGSTASHLVLLAENDIGYHNLMKLVTAAHLEGFYYKPRIDKELLQQHRRGLIGLSACWKGEVAAALLNDDSDRALEAAGSYAEILGKDNFFLEVQNHGTPEDAKINRGMIEISRKTGLLVAATNDVHYLKKEHSEAHEVLLCMQTQTVMNDPKRMRLPAPDYYFKSSAEMAEQFGEIPDAVEITGAIADRCDVEIRMDEMHFPVFQTPDGGPAREYLAELGRRGLAERYGIKDPAEPADDREREILERYRYELEIVEKTGFVNYYLVVWDFVRFARENGIPVGLRGSGGASLLAYTLNITDIEPLKYSLIFERFLNPERVSPPDFDMDFCQQRRGEVIEYIKEKYGKTHVAQIITFGSLGAKLVIRDVGRALGVPYGDCDRFARMVPDDLKITLKQALAKSRELKREYDGNPVCKRILDYAAVLEGLYRNPGTHAAGIVMGERPLDEILPLTRDKDGETITQYSMEPLADLGLLKMDVLGLRTLTVVQETVDLIESTRGITIDLNSIPEDDVATYELFNRGDTVGVFQLESDGMRDLIRRVGMDCIEDLIAMIALYRPGPMNMLDDYVNRKTGKASSESEHPLLNHILKETYGVMVYQEQVQQAASILAGYSLGQGDILRRAMSKKDTEIMEQQRHAFIKGCHRTNRIKPDLAGRIFDTLARFAGYGFNQSHSTAYAMLAYRTAYLKANYPAEFMAAVLSSEMTDSDKIRSLIAETKQMGIEILPPHINESGARFQPVKGAIRFGLVGVKHVGTSAVEAIVAERKENGPYDGLMDFCSRVDAHLVNRKSLESLVKCGCFDSPDVHRARLFHGIDFAMSRAAESQRDRRTGQGSLFSMFDEAGPDDSGELPQHEPWHENELLAAEKEYLGFYISGHPLTQYAALLERYQLSDVHGLAALPGRSTTRIGGVISSVQQKLSKKGDEMAVLQVADLDGSVEVLVFPETYRNCRSCLTPNSAILISGTVRDEEPPKLQANAICPLAEAPVQFVERVSIHVATTHLDDAELAEVRAIMHRHPGPVPVMICLELPAGEKVFVDTDNAHSVTPDESFVREVEHIVGEESVYLAVRGGPK